MKASLQDVAAARDFAETVLRNETFSVQGLLATLKTFLAATAPVEPSGDLVEHLRKIGWDATDGRKALIEGDDFGLSYDGLLEFTRSILSHLAALGMGEAGCLSADNVVQAWFNDPPDIARITNYSPQHPSARRVLARIAPIFAAMAENVRVAEAQAIAAHERAETLDRMLGRALDTAERNLKRADAAEARLLRLIAAAQKVVSDRGTDIDGLVEVLDVIDDSTAPEGGPP